MLKQYLRYILLIVSFLFLLGITFYYNREIKEISTLLELNEWEVTKQRSDIEKTKAEIKKLITEDSLATQIIFANKIENLNLLFELIRDDYGLKNYSFVIKHSNKIEVLRGSSYYDVLSTNVTLSFTSDSRIKLYMFIEELMSKIPGHVHIKSIALTTVRNSLYSVLELEIYTLGIKDL